MFLGREEKLSKWKKSLTVNLKILNFMAEEFLKQICTRSTKESNTVKEKARKYRCLWAFKLNCSMDKHQVSLASFISCLNERISFV